MIPSYMIGDKFRKYLLLRTVIGSLLGPCPYNVGAYVSRRIVIFRPATRNEHSL